ncbi:MAG TPA: hypothetical protein QKA14_00815, partial [Candidatus Megaira endosymbiont of Hartmannula sinica]|nr:hypothetical protein [Candidatus Megaera endosymbiont of Hartmannula sinica]
MEAMYDILKTQQENSSLTKDYMGNKILENYNISELRKFILCRFFTYNNNKKLIKSFLTKEMHSYDKYDKEKINSKEVEYTHLQKITLISTFLLFISKSLSPSNILTKSIISLLSYSEYESLNKYKILENGNNFRKILEKQISSLDKENKNSYKIKNDIKKIIFSNKNIDNYNYDIAHMDIDNYTENRIKYLYKAKIELLNLKVIRENKLVNTILNAIENPSLYKSQNINKEIDIISKYIDCNLKSLHQQTENLPNYSNHSECMICYDKIKDLEYTNINNCKEYYKITTIDKIVKAFDIFESYAQSALKLSLIYTLNYSINNLIEEASSCKNYDMQNHENQEDYNWFFKTSANISLNTGIALGSLSILASSKLLSYCSSFIKSSFYKNNVNNIDSTKQKILDKFETSLDALGINYSEENFEITREITEQYIDTSIKE